MDGRGNHPTRIYGNPRWGVKRKQRTVVIAFRCSPDYLHFMMDSAIGEIELNREVRRFFSIQVRRYLDVRQKPRFSGMPEHDAVLDMIKDAWVELRSSGVLDGVGRRGREAIYHTTIIVFPTFVADAVRNCVRVDFATGRRPGKPCNSDSIGAV